MELNNYILTLYLFWQQSWQVVCTANFPSSQIKNKNKVNAGWRRQEWYLLLLRTTRFFLINQDFLIFIFFVLTFFLIQLHYISVFLFAVTKLHHTPNNFDNRHFKLVWLNNIQFSAISKMWSNWTKFKYVIQTRLVSCERLSMISIAFVIQKKKDYTWLSLTSQRTSIHRIHFLIIILK